MTRLVIITGASKGIGSQMALQASAKFKSSIFLLIARNTGLLDELKAEILAKNSPNEVITLTHDFAKTLNVDQQKDLLKTVLPKDQPFHELYVFYNHGSLTLETVEKMADLATTEFQINTISVWTLMSAIRALFPTDLVPKQFHINTSSLLATVIQPLCSVYSSTRTARASIFKSLAVEQPSLRVLNYQPGPVYTDMFKKVFDNRSEIMSESESKSFGEQYESGKFVKAETTVERLLDIIEKNEFENGSTIDYFDGILNKASE